MISVIKTFLTIRDTNDQGQQDLLPHDLVPAGQENPADGIMTDISAATRKIFNTFMALLLFWWGNYIS
jgi:hypothetical protein